MKTLSACTVIATLLVTSPALAGGYYETPPPITIYAQPAPPPLDPLVGIGAGLANLIGGIVSIPIPQQWCVLPDGSLTPCIPPPVAYEPPPMPYYEPPPATYLTPDPAGLPQVRSEPPRGRGCYDGTGAFVGGEQGGCATSPEALPDTRNWQEE